MVHGMPLEPPKFLKCAPRPVLDNISQSFCMWLEFDDATSCKLLLEQRPNTYMVKLPQITYMPFGRLGLFLRWSCPLRWSTKGNTKKHTPGRGPGT